VTRRRLRPSVRSFLSSSPPPPLRPLLETRGRRLYEAAAVIRIDGLSVGRSVDRSGGQSDKTASRPEYVGPTNVETISDGRTYVIRSTVRHLHRRQSVVTRTKRRWLREHPVDETGVRLPQPPNRIPR